MASTDNATPVLIERPDIHKSCRSLEAIVSVLATYTEATNTLAIVQKKLAKALKEAASVKGTNIVPSNAMTCSAAIFDSLAEVDTKFAKIADKELENVGNDIKKWFKKLSKEEKAHDERIANANTRIKLAGQAYEKKAKRKDRDAVDEHSRYVAVLNSVGPEMSKDKYNHTLFVTQRHTTAVSGFAACVSRLAEAEWTRACEHVRKSASSIGNVGEWRVLCEGGWTTSMPDNLPNPDESDAIDLGKRQAALEASIAPISSQPITVGVDTGPPINTTGYLESPGNSSNPRQPFSPRKSSEGQSSMEQSGTNSMMSRSPSPPATRDLPPHVSNKLIKSALDHEATTVNMSEDKAESSKLAVPLTNGSQEVDTARSNHPFTIKDSTAPLSIVKVASTPKLAERLEPEPDHSIKLAAVATDLPHSRPASSGHDLPPGEVTQSPAVTKNVHLDFVNKRESERQRSSSTENSRSMDGERDVHVGGGLDRRLSIESGNSLVATMRERYDTLPVKPSSPPPRDLPRLAQKVSELATRYTPLETSKYPSRSGDTAIVQSGLSADRFPTFQDKYSRSDRDMTRFRISPISQATPDRDYLDDQKKGQYHYAETPATDRDQFLRDGQDRSPRNPPMSRSPKRNYFDELGVIDHRQRRIDTLRELSFQEREANLREQERMLEIERARLANAREGGYTSDTGRSYRGNSPYERPRRSESPGPMTSQQSLRPYDHSPNCGCQRCSVQHYASTTSLSRSGRDSAMTEQPPIYKPEPPIMLRPEKPKGWLRRMSLPLIPASDKKSPGVSSGPEHSGQHLTSPEDVRRIERSLDFERSRDTGRFGGMIRQ